MYLQASVFSLPLTTKANVFFTPTLESDWTIRSPYSWMSKAGWVSCTQNVKHSFNGVKLQPIVHCIYFFMLNILETLQSVTTTLQGSSHITWAARWGLIPSSHSLTLRDNAVSCAYFWEFTRNRSYREIRNNNLPLSNTWNIIFLEMKAFIPHSSWRGLHNLSGSYASHGKFDPVHQGAPQVQNHQPSCHVPHLRSPHLNKIERTPHNV